VEWLSVTNKSSFFWKKNCNRLQFSKKTLYIRIAKYYLMFATTIKAIYLLSLKPLLLKGFRRIILPVFDNYCFFFHFFYGRATECYAKQRSSVSLFFYKSKQKIGIMSKAELNNHSE